jgi:hypothetical protein
MNCDGVPDFTDTTIKYIDPNNTGKALHEEIKKILSSDVYLILKKILVSSDELEDFIKKEPKFDKPPSDRKEIIQRMNETKIYNKNFNKLLDSAPPRYTNPIDFCNKFDFNDERIPQGVSGDIPLLNTVNGKQFVLGRQRNLFDYYNDKSHFITLNSQFWDLTYLNDVFIECATLKTSDFNEPNKFPVRIVLTKNLFDEPDKSLRVTSFDIDYTISTVLSREICQILKYTDFELYQSVEYKNIFFIGKSGITHDPNNFIKVSSKINRYVLEYYKNKYEKYKNKYLKLKKSII